MDFITGNLDSEKKLEKKAFVELSEISQQGKRDNEGVSRGGGLGIDGSRVSESKAGKQQLNTLRG